MIIQKPLEIRTLPMSQEWNPCLNDYKSLAFLTIHYPVIHISKYLSLTFPKFILTVHLRDRYYSHLANKVYRFNNLPKVSN